MREKNRAEKKIRDLNKLPLFGVKGYKLTRIKKIICCISHKLSTQLLTTPSIHL